MSTEPDAGGAPRDTLDQGSAKSSVEWDGSRMQSGFANVVNIHGTKEQIELFFGTHSSWAALSGGKVKVDLTNRMILTPYAAKRLNTILSDVLREYEARHGVLLMDEGN
ncbi:MAG: DUF3467 domain-containing protein [Rhodobacteraceae bacterium]|nr:DUF3467 domain-containing protein [Paracoccaceae bacterium]